MDPRLLMESEEKSRKVLEIFRAKDAQIEALQSELDDTVSMVTEIQTKLLETKTMLDEAEMRVDSQKRAVAESDRTRNQIQKLLVDKDEVIRQLTSKTTSQAEQIDTLLAEVAASRHQTALRTELPSQQQQIATQQVADLQHKISELVASNMHQQELTQIARDAHSNCGATIRALQEQNELLNRQIEQLGGQLHQAQTLTRSHMDLSTETERDLLAAKQELNKRQERIDELSARVAKLESLQHTAQETTLQSEERLRSALAQATQAGDLEDQVSLLQQQVVDLSGKLDRARHMEEKMADDYAELQAKLVSTTRHHEEIIERKDAVLRRQQSVLRSSTSSPKKSYSSMKDIASSIESSGSALVAHEQGMRRLRQDHVEETGVLKQAADDSQSLVASLHQQVAELENELLRRRQEYQDTLHEHKFRIEDLEKQLAIHAGDKRSRIQSLEETVKSLSKKGDVYADLAKVGREVGSLKLSESRLKTELQYCKQRCERVQGELKDANELITRLQSQLQQYNSASLDSSDQHTLVVSLSAKVDSQSLEIERLQKALEVAKTESRHSTSGSDTNDHEALVLLKRDVAQKTGECETMKSELRVLHVECEKWKQRAADAERTMATYHQQVLDSQRAMYELKEQHTLAEMDLSAKNVHELSSLQQQVYEKERALAGVQASLEAAEHQLQTFQLERSQISVSTSLTGSAHGRVDEKLLDEITTARSEAETSKSEQAKLSAMLSERNVQISILMETMETLQSGDDLAQRVAILTTQLVNEKAIHGAADRKLEEIMRVLQSTHGESQKYLARADALQKQIAEFEAKLFGASSAEAACRQEMISLSQLSRSQAAQLASHSREIVMLRDSVKRAENDTTAVRKELQEQRRRHASALQTERTATSSTIQALQQQIISLSSKQSEQLHGGAAHTLSLSAYLRDLEADVGADHTSKGVVQRLSATVLEADRMLAKANTDRQMAVWECERLRIKADLAVEEVDNAHLQRTAASQRVEYLEKQLSTRQALDIHASDERVALSERRMLTMKGQLDKAVRQAIESDAKSVQLHAEIRMLRERVQNAEQKVALMEVERREEVNATAAQAESLATERLSLHAEEIKKYLYEELSSLISDTDDRLQAMGRELCASKLAEKELLSQLSLLHLRYSSSAAAAASLRGALNQVSLSVRQNDGVDPSEYATVLKRLSDSETALSRERTAAQNALDELAAEKHAHAALQLMASETQSRVAEYEARLSNMQRQQDEAISHAFATSESSRATELSKLQNQLLEEQKRHVTEVSHVRSEFTMLMEKERKATEERCAQQVQAIQNQLDTLVGPHDVQQLLNSKEKIASLALQVEKGRNEYERLMDEHTQLSSTLSSYKLQINDLLSRSEVQAQTIASLQQAIADMASAGSRESAAPAEQLTRTVTQMYTVTADALKKVKDYAAGAADLRKQITKKDDRIRELKSALDTIKKGSKSSTPSKDVLSDLKETRTVIDLRARLAAKEAEVNHLHEQLSTCIAAVPMQFIHTAPIISPSPRMSLLSLPSQAPSAEPLMRGSMDTQSVVGSVSAPNDTLQLPQQQLPVMATRASVSALPTPAAIDQMVTALLSKQEPSGPAAVLDDKRGPSNEDVAILVQTVQQLTEQLNAKHSRTATSDQVQESTRAILQAQSVVIAALSSRLRAAAQSVDKDVRSSSPSVSSGRRSAIPRPLPAKRGASEPPMVEGDQVPAEDWSIATLMTSQAEQVKRLVDELSLAEQKLNTRFRAQDVRDSDRLARLSNDVLQLLSQINAQMAPLKDFSRVLIHRHPEFVQPQALEQLATAISERDSLRDMCEKLRERVKRRGALLDDSRRAHADLQLRHGNCEEVIKELVESKRLLLTQLETVVSAIEQERQQSTETERLTEAVSRIRTYLTSRDRDTSGQTAENLLEKLNSEHASLSQQLLSADAQAKTQTERIKVLEAEVSQLRHAVREQSNKDDSFSVDGEVTDLVTRCTSLSKEVEQLKQQRQQLHNQLDSVRATHQAEIEAKTELSRKLHLAEADVETRAALVNALEDEKTAAGVLRQELRSLAERHEREIARLNDQVSKMRGSENETQAKAQQVQHLQKACDELQRALAAADDERHQAVSALHTIEHEYESYRIAHPSSKPTAGKRGRSATRDTKTGGKGTATTSTGARGRSRSKSVGPTKADLRAELNEKGRLLAVIQAEMDTLRIRTQRMEQERERLPPSSSTATALSYQQQLLRAANDEISAIRSALESERNRSESLQNQYQSVLRELDDVRRAASDTEARHQSAVEELRRQQQRHTETVKRAVASETQEEEDKRVVLEKLRETRLALKNATEDSARKSRLVSSAKTERDEFELQLKEARETAQSAEEKAKKLEKEIQRKDTLLKELRLRYDTMTGSAKTEGETRKLLEDKLKAANDDIIRKDAQVRQLRAKLEALNSDSGTLQTIQEANHTLEETVKKLKQDLERKEAALKSAKTKLETAAQQVEQKESQDKEIPRLEKALKSTKAELEKCQTTASEAKQLIRTVVAELCNRLTRANRLVETESETLALNTSSHAHSLGGVSLTDAEHLSKSLEISTADLADIMQAGRPGLSVLNSSQRLGARLGGPNPVAPAGDLYLTQLDALLQRDDWSGVQSLLMRLCDDLVQAERTALSLQLKRELAGEEEELVKVSDSLRRYETAIRTIKQQLKQQQQEHRSVVQMHEQTIASLKEHVHQLELAQ